MIECRKCGVYGLNFQRPYSVAEFLEGYRDSPIWIVGLNPAAEPGWEDTRTVEELQEGFFEIAQTAPYFRDFRRVSEWLYSQMGKVGGVAHTDLVKCSSKSWPPAVCSGQATTDVISNCSPFLLHQIELHKPRMIICNGTHVGTFMKKAIPATEPLEQQTSYRGIIGGIGIWVVLSGFIGRIDNYARSRLGREIERIAERIGIKDGGLIS